MVEAKNPCAQSTLPLMMSKELDPVLKITISALNGRDYITWAEYGSLYLSSKSKIDFINGKITPK